MRTINSEFTHDNLRRKIQGHADWNKSIPGSAIRAKPMAVKTYDQLVQSVAQIYHYNRNHTLYFRGQGNDYKDHDDLTLLLPSLYRKDKNGKTPVKERFKLLNEKSRKLVEALKKRDKGLAGTALLKKYHELQWAILQHYEVCPTPLLDITHSLHVACSFALDNNKSKFGIVYAIGLPHRMDSVSYNTYDELLNIKLLGFCPPQAQRPFFQEGYLAGPFPFFGIDKSNRATQFDFARRLIAKFEIPNSSSFWGEGFSAIPHGKLYPEKDLMRDICSSL